jgi:hypothetical protein
MGTTVTTNLGLIKPDLNESIKEALPTFPGWAAQNTINMDKLDALFRSTNATWTLNWTADTTNPTLGTGGFTEGKFLRLWPKMVIAYFRLFTGTASFTAGTGTYRLNLPVAMSSGLMGIMPIGKAMFRDDSASLTSQLFTVNYDSADGKVFCTTGPGSLWSATTPVVPANNDRIGGWFMYPTDAA